jgi:hypothetical protein
MPLPPLTPTQTDIVRHLFDSGNNIASIANLQHLPYIRVYDCIYATARIADGDAKNSNYVKEHNLQKSSPINEIQWKASALVSKILDGYLENGGLEKKGIDVVAVLRAASSIAQGYQRIEQQAKAGSSSPLERYWAQIVAQADADMRTQIASGMLPIDVSNVSDRLVLPPPKEP